MIILLSWSLSLFSISYYTVYEVYSSSFSPNLPSTIKGNIAKTDTNLLRTCLTVSVTHYNLFAAPRFNGVLLIAVNRANEASVLQQEVSSPLLKGAIEPYRVLSSPKEGWGFVSYTRSAQAELFPLQREIQDADAQEHSFPGPRGDLVCQCRLEGSTYRWFRGTGSSLGSPSGERLINTWFFPLG